MKNAFVLLLIVQLVLPAFAPWLPHEAVHILHGLQADHVSVDIHVHNEHRHTVELEEPQHHPILIDAVTYVSDYLNVDFQKPDRIVLQDLALDSQQIDSTSIVAADLPYTLKLVNTQSQGPPDWRKLTPENIPPYLSTQRLRI